MAGDQRIVSIELDSLSRTGSPLALTAMLGRSMLIYFLGFGAALGWVVLTIIPFAQADGPIMIVAVPLIFGPFVYLFYRVISGSARWSSGIGSFITTKDFAEAQLKQNIPRLGISLRELLDRVTAFAAGLGTPVLAVSTDPARRARSALLRLGGYAVIVGGIAIGATNGQAGFFIGVVGFLAGGKMLQESRKTLQPDATSLLAADRRKPVLLLRSFRDEYLHANQFLRTPLGYVSLQRRFEQGIAGSLGTFGPLIAIGVPGEKLPQIGAARTYLSDAEWQPAVTRYMAQSVMIAMIAGATEWIRWELHTILEQGHVSRLMILMPPEHDAARWANVVTAMAGTRWSAALAGLDVRKVVLVQLRPDGTVIAIRKSTQPFIQDYQLAIAIAVYEEFCRGTK